MYLLKITTDLASSETIQFALNTDDFEFSEFDMKKLELKEDIEVICNKHNKQIYQKKKLQIFINKTIPDQLESAELMMQNMQITPIIKQGNINYTIENLF